MATRIFTSDYREKRAKAGHVDPFPTEILKRADKPTTIIHQDQVLRLDERQSGFNKAFSRDYGPRLANQRHRMVTKHPLSGVLVGMQNSLADPEAVDGPVAEAIAPGTDDPLANVRNYQVVGPPILLQAGLGSRI